MDSIYILQWLSLAVTIAILVILIVVLARNQLPDAASDSAKITMLDNKINWLYALEIAAVALMLLVAIWGMLMYRRLPLTVC